MQNIFIDVLPPWVETGLQPAFYDLESGTVLQQTARMYAKVRELTEGFNTFTENVTNEVNTFENSVNATVADYIEKCEKDAQAARHQPIRPLNQDVFFKPDYTDKPRNPLLVVYPVQLMYESKQGEDYDISRQAAVDNTVYPLIGLSVGIPRIKGREPKQYQYKINIVKYRELMGFEDGADAEADESIED
jgi:hypothetical protein